jgi:alpha-glucuronidase
MIIYNETIIVDESIHKQWLSWMQSEYIPQVMKTGHFISYKILNVLDSPNEGVTYCIQYQTDKREKYNEFNTKHWMELQALHQLKFENQFVLFNTLMQTIS